MNSHQKQNVRLYQLRGCNPSHYSVAWTGVAAKRKQMRSTTSIDRSPIIPLPGPAATKEEQPCANRRIRLPSTRFRIEGDSFKPVFSAGWPLQSCLHWWALARWWRTRRPLQKLEAPMDELTIADLQAA